MSEISSVNTSFYSELVEGFTPKTTLAVPAVQTEPRDETAGFSGGSTYSEPQPEVDLSNYYNEVRPEDLLTKSGQYLLHETIRQRLHFPRQLDGGRVQTVYLLHFRLKTQ